MKKQIAILVMLALVTSGVAFAQISGDLNMGITLIHAYAEGNDTDVKMGDRGPGFSHDNGSKWSITFGEGKGIGRVVYRLHDNSLWGWFQWSPIEQLRIRFGWDRDGYWGAAQISAWGFTAIAKDLVTSRMYNGGLYFKTYQSLDEGTFYPGIGDGDRNMFSISILPMDGLQINFAIPSLTAAQEMSIKLASFHANIVYNIEDVGTARLSFVGRGGLGKDQEKVSSPGNVYASFYLTAIDAIRLDLGLMYRIPYKNTADQDMAGRLSAGLGMTTSAGPFGFKLRAGALLGGKDKGADMDTVISAGILPSYKFSAFTLYFHTGLGVLLPAADGADTVVEWFVSPYLQIPTGGFNFWVGLQIEKKGPAGGTSAGKNNDNVVWGIPIGFNVSY